MADLVPYSQAASTSLVSTLQNTDIMALAREDAQSDTGYTSKVVRVDNIGKKVVNGIDYTTDLKTSNKSITGAINEVYGTWLTATLTTGSTSVTISDASITSTSFIQVFAGNGNINYTSISSTTGSVTVGFLAQASDMTVTVRII